MTALATVRTNDRIAIFWRDANGKLRAQGKRVARGCPLSHNERREYVKLLGSPVLFCKFLMNSRGITLSEAWAITKKARGYDSYRNAGGKLL